MQWYWKVNGENRMSKKGRFSEMLIPTIVMGVIAVALLVIGYLRGGGEHIIGLKSGGILLVQILPLLIFAFIIAGMVPILMPTELISRWIGAESGIRGILIGTVVGGLMPGGPYVCLPIAAGLLQVGASVGTMVAFITAWSLWAVSRLPLDIAILGWQFTLIRLACTFFFPPIAGLIANAIFPNVRLT
jgi:uncharacterized membrane protein YraQ (UPF0718 family)